MRLSGRRGVRAGVLVALGAAALSVPAGAALKEKSASIELPADDGAGSVAVECKKGTRAVSGGFDGPDLDPTGNDGPLVEALVSQRTGKREWTTSGVNYGQPGELVGIVYCSKTLPRLKAKSVTRAVGPNQNLSLSARCKKGREAVSGGYISEDFEADYLYPYESRREGKRTWTVSGFNFTGGGSHDLTAIAYCAKDKLGLKAKSAETTITEIQSIAFAEARCKKGTKAVSGGFSGFVDGNLPQSFPNQSMRTGGRRWATQAFASGNPANPLTWQTFVYCLDKDEL